MISIKVKIDNKEYFVRSMNLEMQYIIVSADKDLKQAFKFPTNKIQEIKLEQ